MNTQKKQGQPSTLNLMFCLSFDKKQNNFFVEDKYVKTHGSCKLKLSLENKISSTSQGQSSTLNLMFCLSFDKKQNIFFVEDK